MRNKLLPLLLLACLAGTAWADSYRLCVDRIGDNLYQDRYSGVVVVTEFCFEFAFGEEAILVWQGPYSYQNKLLFTRSGRSYRVERLLRD